MTEPRKECDRDAGALRGRISISGTVATLLATAGFVAAGLYLAGIIPADEKAATADRKAAVSAAYARLRKIAEAQERYRAVDWDADGLKTYARFLPHLWQTVDRHDRPVKTRLISRTLAFATAPERSAGGYYYRMLYRRGDEARARSIDHRAGWAVAAMPADPRRSGQLALLCDQRKTVYVRTIRAAVTRLPAHPERAGWQAIANVEALRDYLEDGRGE